MYIYIYVCMCLFTFIYIFILQCADSLCAYGHETKSKFGVSLIFLFRKYENLVKERKRYSESTREKMCVFRERAIARDRQTHI